MSVGPIDFVVTWVNEADASWQQRRRKAMGERSEDDFMTFDVRFRDWGFLQYWFRAVAEFAPWVNRVHFVHSGAIPDWLDVQHPKLAVWEARDLIGRDVDTFNSHSIEARLHTIPGLTEQYVYFNDDTFIGKPLRPEFYFANGLPYGLNAPVISYLDTEHSHAVLHSTGLINEHFGLKQYRRTALARSAHLLFSSDVLRLPLFYAAKGIPPTINAHLPQPYLKSVVEEAFAAGADHIEEARTTVFRSRNEISPMYFARQWHFAKGRYRGRPRRAIGQFLWLDAGNMSQAEALIRAKRTPQYCLNDRFVGDATSAISSLHGAFDSVFPGKSQFER